MTQPLGHTDNRLKTSQVSIIGSDNCIIHDPWQWWQCGAVGGDSVKKNIRQVMKAARSKVEELQSSLPAVCQSAFLSSCDPVRQHQLVRTTETTGGLAKKLEGWYRLVADLRIGWRRVANRSVSIRPIKPQRCKISTGSTAA